MHIIEQIVSTPPPRIRALFRARGLNEFRIRYFLIVASSGLIRSFSNCCRQRRELGLAEPGIDALLCMLDIRTLAARVHLDAALTAKLVQLLIPGVLARVHDTLRSNRSLLTLCNRRAAA